MDTDTPSAGDISSLVRQLASGGSQSISSPRAEVTGEATPLLTTAHRAFQVDCKAGTVTIANSVCNPFHLQKDMAEVLTHMLAYVNGEP